MPGLLDGDRAVSNVTVAVGRVDDQVTSDDQHAVKTIAGSEVT